MNDISPLGQKAIEHARRGDFEQALALARQAITERPADVGLRVFIAMLHGRRGELGESVPHLREAVQRSPGDLFVRTELIRVLIGLGELEEALGLLDRPGLPPQQSLRLRSMLLHRSDDVAAAGELYRQLVAVDPRDFEGWNGLGLCRLATGEPRAAIQAFDRALALKPDALAVRQKWAEAYVAIGEGENALAKLQVEAKSAAGATLFLTIGHLEDLLGRQEQALAALEEAVQCEAANADALGALAEKLEQQNDIPRFEEVLGQLSGLPQPGVKLPLLKARLAYRQGEFERALTLAMNAPPSSDVGSRAQLIGQCLDRLGDASGAFDAFLQMNAEDARTGSDVSSTTRRTRAELEDQRSLLTRDWIAGWHPAPRPERLPAFLVGFPRSGTTLLDTLLMGHPDTAVAEEEPMLATIGKKLGDLARLADLSADEIESLRNVYFDVAERYAPDAAKLLIDKNPFAMGSVPIAHRLFPGAPIIFMERHPCDVVLSCFMTRFQPTGIGTNFLTLQDTALLYDQMMQLWAKAAELLPIKLHTIRYERLVDDLESELRPLATFLGLTWIPELVDHRQTAMKRSFIKTPSYAQVTEPVTKKAVGRWLRYRDQLEPVLPVLEPWIRSMGYELPA